MSFEDNKVTLLNYNPFTVCVPTETRTYTFSPCYDYGRPTIVNVSFPDVEYINSRSNAFRNGLLFFLPEKQESIYKVLSIFDWKNILTNQEIEQIMLNPTVDGIKKLISVKDVSVFDRVYSIMTYLSNSEVDLSNRVIRVIRARHRELKRGIFNTQIEVQENILDTKKENVDALKKQNELLMNELKELKKQVSALTTSKRNTTTAKSTGRKVGRPKSTK